MKLSFKTRKLKGSLIRINTRFKKLDFTSDSLEVYGVSNKEGITITGNVTSKNLDNYIFVKGESFVYNPYRINVGSIGLSEKKFQGLVSPAYIVFKTDETINDEFLEIYLRSSIGLNLVKWYGDRGGVRASLRFQEMEKIDFPDLTYKEQTAILCNIKEKYSHLTALKKEIQTQKKLLTQLRKAILQEAVQGKLVPQDPADEPASVLLERIKTEKAKLVAAKKIRKPKYLPPIGEEEKPFELPDGWVWCRLVDIVNTIFDGPFGSHLKTKDYTDSGVRVIRLENLGFLKFKIEKETFISEEKYLTLTKHTIYEDDIIMGSFISDGVKSTVIPKFTTKVIAKADCFCIRIFRNHIIKELIPIFLSSKINHQQLSAQIHGITRQRINTTQLKKLVFPLPPLPEQKRIVTKVQQLLGHCEALEAEVLEREKAVKVLVQAVLGEAFEQSK